MSTSTNATTGTSPTTGGGGVRALGVGTALRLLVGLLAVAAVAVAVAAVTASWVARLAAQGLALAAVAVAGLALHALWLRLGRLEQRVGRVDRALAQGRASEAAEAEDQAARLRGSVSALYSVQRDMAEQLGELAGRLVGGPGTAGPDAATLVGPGTAHLSPRHARSMLDLFLEVGDVMAADGLVRSHGLLTEVPLKWQRHLGRQLRERGYLERALVYFTAAAASGDERDAHALRVRRSEVDVLRGERRPSLPATPVEPVRHRVLHVVGKTLPSTQSGYTLRTHYTALAQAGTGVEPHVVSQAGTTADEVPRVEHVDGVPYHRVPGPAPHAVGLAEWLDVNTQGLLDVVQRVRPAVLHAHSDFVNALCAQAVGEATGIPVLYESRGFWEESWMSRTLDRYGWEDAGSLVAAHGTPEAYAWRRDREDEARSRADHVVTLARVMAERIEAAGLDRDRLTLAPNAVDADAFPVLERDEALARQVGVGDDELVIGYISSIVEYEGIDTLVDAFAAVQQRTEVPLRLLVVGGGPVLAGLQQRAASLGLDRATFTGRVGHDVVDSYYSLIDVFVVPRRPTDVCHLVTPLKPFEAFATGRTVVLSDVRALREIAEDSGAAALFRAGDATSLADTLLELVQDPGRRQDLAARGAAWVRNERTWAANAATYLRTYARLGAVPLAPGVHAAETADVVPSRD